MGGWRRGLPVVLSPLISDPPIVIAILLLLNKLPAHFLNAISLLGGGFALYLAWGFWKHWRQASKVPAEQHPTLGRTADPASGSWSILRRGVLMNLLSPGVYTFWVFVLGPLFLQALQHSLISGCVFLLCFYGAFVGGMALLVGMFHQARRLGWQTVRALTLISLMILTIFGMLLLWRGAHLVI